MSYCRFSSNDYQCDVYVFASANGYTTHVAASRVVFARPLPPPVVFSEANIDAWVGREFEVNSIVEISGRKPLTLPLAGRSFDDESASVCADRLEKLRSLGYRVPQHAIDSLREDAAAVDDAMAREAQPTPVEDRPA
jgi:hypothetical protein